MKRYLLILLIFTIHSSINCYAQNKLITKADEQFNNYDYSKALKQYLKAYRQQVSLYHSTIQTAHCYRLTNQPIKATEWYKKAIEFPEYDKSMLFYLGQMLAQTNQPDEAAKYMSRYFDNAATWQHQLTANYSTQMAYLTKERHQFEITSSPINTEFSEIGPVSFNNELYFASNRPSKLFVKRLDVRNTQSFYDIYHCKTNFNNKPTLAEKAFNTKFNDGPIAFSFDGNMAFITRNIESKNNQNEATIYVSIFNNGHFSEEPIPLPIHQNGFSMIHPCMSPDGKMLWLASNIPQGFGGFDIYYSEFKNGFWSEPVNAGPNINTLGNDVFPFISADGTLFWASDGHPGFGGLDLFYAMPMPNNSFSIPFNLGANINTPFDDFGINFNSGTSQGFFVSNRPTGKGMDDIYQFSVVSSIRYSLVTATILASDEAPLSDATITVLDGDGKIFNTVTSNENGQASFYLPSFESFSLSVRKKLYQNREIILSPATMTDKTASLEIRMEKK